MAKTRSFLRGFWRVITFPFRAIWRLVRLPLQAFKRAQVFLTEEPEERPLTETLAATFQQPSTLIEHIDALRKHLLRMVLALVIGVAICAAFTSQLIDLLAKPIGGIKTLQAIDVTESVGTFMLVALVAGFALILPYITFELWLFAAPGLHARARKLGLLGIPLALIFFLGGMAFAYFLLLPTALPFLLNFMGIHTIPRVSSYVNLRGRSALLDRHLLRVPPRDLCHHAHGSDQAASVGKTMALCHRYNSDHRSRHYPHRGPSQYVTGHAADDIALLPQHRLKLPGCHWPETKIGNIEGS